MRHRLVAPVWHNREVHRDFERWSFRKRTIYDPGNYVDVGGHGALILPGSFQLQPTRKYKYQFAATGCALPVNSETSSSPVAFVDFDPEHKKLLIGETLGGIIRRNPDASESEKIDIRGIVSVKVQDFRADSVTIGVASRSEITALRGITVVAKQELDEAIDSFDLSPFIQTELVTSSRNSLRLADLTFSLKSNLMVEDVSFFTHPRHLAVVHSDSVIHCDVRTPGTSSKIVDSNCLNLLPKNCFSSAKVNCRNVNQLFVLSSDCLSLWDVRYSTQPMGVFNHYVSRSTQLFGIQTLPAGDSLFVLVRSSARSTLFEFDSTFDSPNAALSSPQLQFAAPADMAHYYYDQTGDEISQQLWKRLSQPVAGSCLVPESENDFSLHTFTTTGDWFTQRILRLTPSDSEDFANAEKTFAFGMDSLPLNDDQLEQVKERVKKLHVNLPSKPSPESKTASLTIGSTELFLEGPSSSRTECPVCSSDGRAVTREHFCNNCKLGTAAGLLNDAWVECGLIRETEDLTEEEEAVAKELLGQNVGGLAVSDAVRAVWGEVDWRVAGETGTDATAGDVDDPAEAEENADGYDDED